MNRDDDRDLRELFSVAREDDQRRAPSFATLIARRRRPGSRVVRNAIAGALAAAAMLLVAVYAVFQRPDSSRGPMAPALTIVVDPRSTKWESPTDFLLATPAHSLMRTLPTLRYLDNDIPSITPPRTSPARAGRLKS